MNTFCLVAAVTLAIANAGVIGPAVLSHNVVAPVIANVVVPAGHGAEGQYVPDLTEKLYDDGSYKPELRTIPLAPSPYGLVEAGSGLEGQYVPELETVELKPSPYGLTPAGSGLEGAYVHDYTEKLYDDGSYKPEVNVISAVHVAPAAHLIQAAHVVPALGHGRIAW